MALRLGHEMYYMAHLENLSSILEKGILSHALVQSSCPQRVDISNRSVQRLRMRREPVHGHSLHEYVPLYFNPRNPMLYRLRDIQHTLVILKISMDVAQSAAAVLYTDGNAACLATRFSSDVNITGDSAEVLRAQFWTHWEDGSRRRCAEMLVHQQVPARLITGVACSNPALAKAVMLGYDIATSVDRDLFF